MHLLYMKPGGQEGAVAALNPFLEECTLAAHRPVPGRLCIPGESLSLKAWLGRLYFWLISRGKFCIFYLQHKGKIVHTSYVVPPCGKFSFLHEGDFEIGPCMTVGDYRGRGCYPYVLNAITERKACGTGNYYMIVRDDNSASVKGIEKAGFRLCGTVTRSRIRKAYRKGKD